MVKIFAKRINKIKAEEGEEETKNGSLFTRNRLKHKDPIENYTKEAVSEIKYQKLVSNLLI